MMRIQEDAVDLRRRMGDEELDTKVIPRARLLDSRKAYPRVNKPALWMLLKRYGLGGLFLRVIMDLHEGTEYKIRGKAGYSETWVPERGLREGCPSSPDLFNIFHQAPMRVAEMERRVLAATTGRRLASISNWCQVVLFRPSRRERRQTLRR